MTERKVVYAYGHPSNNAYLIQKGEITVDFPDGPPLMLQEATLLAGTVEHLLAQNPEQIPPRLFSLTVSEDT
ncbi:MAG: hypothetical protein KDD55_04570, partial [Bdellovibrionales bacterium]|nr:hypothetical protein [Bdellovibrionales bacterium]